MKFYDLSTIFNFGKYQGKTLKEVLDSDKPYIERCLINLDHFIIDDDELERIKIMTPGFEFSHEAELERNRKKDEAASEEDSEGDTGFDNSFDDQDSYGSSGKKYGWYNGWSDDAIDDAFEGDPMNTWNVD